MAEIERNPLAVRQGAAAVACIAAAAVAMPVISHRAAEQRQGAEWAAAHSTQLAQNTRDPSANIQLIGYSTSDGLRARGTGALFTQELDAHALLVQAALRGPLAPQAGTVEPARPQIDAAELNCLAQAVYYEARGETYQGQLAVAEVVMNRVRSKFYPKSICRVVYQGSERGLGCQFTFTCDGSVHRRPRGAAWARAQNVASQVMQGYARPVTQRATHYHTRAVDPIWSAGLVETTRIGSHVFYRFPTLSERPLFMEALSRRRAASRSNGAAAPLIPAAPDAAADAAATAESVREQPQAQATTPAASAGGASPSDVGAY